MLRSIRPLTARLLNGLAALALVGTGLSVSAHPASAQTLPPNFPPTLTLLPGKTFTVTTNADTNNGACDGQCSLRDAIAAANSNNPIQTLPRLPDEIVFRLPQTQALVIQLQSPLPPLTSPVTVDGSNLPITQFVLIQGQLTPITISHPGNLEVRGGAGVTTGLSVATSATVRDLVLSGFSNTGVELANNNSQKTLERLTLRGNGTGMNNLGSNATLRNNTITQNVSGVRMGGSQSTLSGNTITANTGAGVSITGSNHTVSGNTITGNSGTGVAISGGSHTIGGTTATARNVISGNGGNGVSVISSAGAVRIVGNFIGTDATGSAALANASNGILITTANSPHTIGGATAGERNVISGNGSDGIEINLVLTPAPSTVVVQGNFIGTNAAGTAAVSNGGKGINVGGFTGTGGDDISPRAQIVGNVISSNLGGGVLLFGGARHVLQSNFIGTDASGTLNLGNGANGFFHGVFIQDARLVTIGGADATLGNVIAHNANSGVTVFTATADSQTAVGNTIRLNRIFSNGSRGIDLAQTSSEAGFGLITPNDAGDADNGANHRQNFPVVATATVSTGGLTVTGTLNSTASQNFALDFYTSPTCDSGGSGEGAQVLGSTQVTTDASGNASFNALTLGSPVTSGVVTATATSLATGDTSEFSVCATIS